ncbi:Flavin containing amine oxidoreductase [Ceratobasidium sp. AG-Ba]|nr:Flavin containing amine oxidoreductase [Ceratobasidium sp. AG-Ba]
MADYKIGPFMNALATNWKDGWEKMKHFDRWSTRGYMGLEPGSAPGYADNVRYFVPRDLQLSYQYDLYDCALTESVLDALDFDLDPPPVWKCIKGGTDLIISRAIDKISTPVQRGQRVTAIAPVGDAKIPHAISLVIKNERGTIQKEYDHVVSTVPLSCLGQIDTSHFKFPWNLQTAIRELHYDGSTKVAIRFSKRWWEDPKVVAPQIGGVSSTDRPTRTVVYPSYGIHTQSASMIVSYTWAQDAFRAGSLAQGRDSVAERALIENILKDLTDMHQIKDETGQTDYTLLPRLMQDYHAWNWYGNEFSMGAFALFGPGQFENLYPQVTMPHFGRLHFAGEATSVHHAWVVGALNSAYRSLVEIFEHEDRRDLIELLKVKGSPFINAGTFEVDQGQVNLQVRLGQAMYAN